MTDTAQPIAALLDGVFAAVNVPSATALATGGIYNDLPPNPTYPCVRLWARGKPVGPIAGSSVWEADVEIWIYSLYSGDVEALALAEVIGGLLHYQTLTTPGWNTVLVAWEDLFSAADEDLEGQPLKAWVLSFRVHLERA